MSRAYAIVPCPLDAVIFDMDGLLLDTERLQRDAMTGAGRALGYPFDDLLFERIVGIHRDGNRVTLAEHFGAEFPLDAFYLDSDARFAGLSAGGIPLRPGVVELLDHLAARGVPCGVATSTLSPRAEQHLRHVGLFDRFATVVTRSDVERPKPAPDPYLLAAERLGARPAHCLALEDSPNGIRAAAAAGMAVVMIPDILPPTAETEGLVRATLPSLADVLALLVEAGV